MCPEISVIILNFNTNKYTIDCVNSIIEKTGDGTTFEIIVVDNGSKVSAFGKLTEDLKPLDVTLVRSDVNLGFSGGLQAGINHASGNYFFFLNNDSLLLNDVLSEFITFSRQNTDAGVLGGQIFDEIEESRTSFGYQPTISIKVFGHRILGLLRLGKFPSRKKANEIPIEVHLISGSGMFISKVALEKIGGLDLNYFLYSEEEDLALRAQKTSYKNYYIPTACYIHYQGKSSNEPTLSILERQHRSLVYFYQKNYGSWYQKIVFMIMFLIYTLKSFRKKKHVNVIRAIRKASKTTMEQIIQEGSARKKYTQMAYIVKD